MISSREYLRYLHNIFEAKYQVLVLMSTRPRPELSRPRSRPRPEPSRPRPRPRPELSRPRPRHRLARPRPRPQNRVSRRYRDETWYRDLTSLEHRLQGRPLSVSEEARCVLEKLGEYKIQCLHEKRKGEAHK